MIEGGTRAIICSQPYRIQDNVSRNNGQKNKYRTKNKEEMMQTQHKNKTNDVDSYSQEVD